ncbi:hypothetical protein SLS64_009079 [Diaporthe eres]|uniref:Uncharacterized protein n=1 Tax=Diaporthe eres TaxID=83184 RepID=A0ABR1NQ29_DIAER
MDPNAKVEKGSTSIQLMPPPKMAIPKNPNHRWYTFGANHLNPGSQSAFALAVQMQGVNRNDKDGAEVFEHAEAFRNKKYFIPEREDNIFHSNEADVVRSADLYLIHPVMQALAAHPRYHRSVISRSEDTLKDSRTDMTFYIPVQSGDHRPFAVVEYKKRQAFQAAGFNHEAMIPQALRARVQALQAEFDQNLLTPSPQAQAAFKQLFEGCGVKADDSDSTLFTGSENNLIKQAASYMVAYRVRHVALFNWDCMVLCYFPWLDRSKTVPQLEADYRGARGTKNTPARPGISYPVEVDIYPHGDPNTRLALMAFMQHAWEETYNS